MTSGTLSEAEKKTRSALDCVSVYSAALATADTKSMEELRATNYVLDWVHGDAFEDPPLTSEEAARFWPSWLAGFPVMDYEITRTIAGETVVVVQWIFTGTHSARIEPPIFNQSLEPSGRTIRFRGISVFDVADGLIQKETAYIDLATLFVELGMDE
jgi:predicted ester cyclase